MKPLLQDLTLEHVSCNLCGSKDAQFALRLKDRFYNLPGEFTMVRCRQCGLFYLNPRPSESSMPHYYPETYYSYENFAAIPVRTHFSGFTGYLKRKIFDMHSLPGSALRFFFVQWHSNWRWFYAANPTVQKGRMLEIGCGAGQTLLFFKQFGWEVVGSDISSEAARTGAQNGITILRGDAAYKTLPQNSFDFIWMSHTFEHLRDPRAMLELCKKILKPEGKIVLTIPVADALAPWLFRSYSPVWDTPRHLTLFTAETLQKMSQECGFKCKILSRNCGPAILLTSYRHWLQDRAGKSYQSFGIAEKILMPLFSILAFFIHLIGQGEELSVELRHD